MNISVVGSGYVGLVSAACFSEMGNHVVCVDIDEKKILNLKKGIVPIYEPGLSVLIHDNFKKGNIDFTTNIKDALDQSDLVFIAVGTPMGDDGSADLTYVLNVAKDIAKYMSHRMVIINKSTVPVGTAMLVKNQVQDILNERKSSLTFDIVSNPEFLKEGSAIDDFMRPDRIVVGTENDQVMRKMQQLYSPFILNHDRFISMDIASAEMTKYAANAMLATKISFINEIANICEKVGADVNQVRIGIGSDKRIGYKFIYPGCGYGGSCFPKDVEALINTAKNNGYTPQLISSVEKVNNDQKNILFSKIKSVFGNDLTGKTFAIWGLSFKPGTDDMRAAPSINLIQSIIQAGGHVNAYDPKAMDQAKYYLKGLDVNYCKDKYETLSQANALLLVTEWKEFRSPDFVKMANLMKQRILIDGRNQFNAEFIQKNNFQYLQIGVKYK